MISSIQLPNLRFILATTLLAGGYGLLAVWFPLLLYFNQAPLPDVRTLAPTLTGGLAYALLLAGLYGVYLWLYRQVQNRPQPWWLLISLTLLMALPLLFTFPINATDVYRYVLWGRVQSVYGANPYETAVTEFPDDRFTPLAGEWGSETSPYGPLWELLGHGLTAVTKNSLLAGLLAYKLAGLMGHLLVGWLIWRLLAHSSATHQSATTLLWLWNPALLLTFVMDAHNDVWMIFFLLLGLGVWQHGRFAAGLIIMGLAALTKPIALLALPLFFLAGWRSLPNGRLRWRYLLWTTIGGLITAALAFAPYGSPVSLALRLLRESANAPGFSPATLILLLQIQLQGTPTWTAVATTGYLFFTGLLLWLLWRTWYGRSPIRSSADIFAGYLLQAFSFRIWYAAWPFPWLLLDETTPAARTAYRLRVGLWFLLTTQLSVILYGHLRVYLLGGSQFWAHLLGIPFTFGLPFLLAKAGNR